MSINVTVNGNPLYLGRGKVLLTDIETAKKNEWMRRRKIRLQQARQQAKDLARSVRTKVSHEEIILDKHEEEKEAEVLGKQKEKKIAVLKNEFQQSLESVGAGHHMASIQTECESLVREKQELQNAIAKARGEIAEERLKVEKCLQKEKSQVTAERKKMIRQIEDIRSAMISNLPEPKSSSSTAKKPSPLKNENQQRNEEEVETSVSSKKVFSPSKKFASSSRQREQQSAKRSSLSPPRSLKQHFPGRHKHKDPEGNDKEGSSEEEDSEDSDVTWPPRTARVTKEPLLPQSPPRVRFYDHNSRVIKNSPRPSYCVRHMDPFEQPDMTEAIAEEEQAIVRKENLDRLARREKMIRGNKALRKERGKRETEKFLKDLREMHRKEKIQMAVERSYPSDIHTLECQRNEVDPRKKTEMAKSTSTTTGTSASPVQDTISANGVTFEADAINTIGVQVTKFDPGIPPKIRFELSSDNEELFEELLMKLKKERARRLELETKFGVQGVDEADIPRWVKENANARDVAGRVNEADIPRWVKENENAGDVAGPSGTKMVPSKQDRAVSPLTPETINKPCSCSSRCACGTFPVENYSNESEQKQPVIILDSEGKQILDEAGTSKKKDLENVNLSSKTSDKDEPVSAEQQIFEDKEIFQGVSAASGSSRPSSNGEGIEYGIVTSKSSSMSDTVESSLTFEGIKVTVKVSEKGKKRKDRSSRERGHQTTDKDVQTSLEPTEGSSTSRNMTWNNRLSSTEEPSSGSTTYMSPPSMLNPANQALLRDVLKKIDTKNKNPRLHQYIQRVLEMSRQSIDDLPVSSVSDISISSSIFNRSSNKRSSSLGDVQENRRRNAASQARICSDDSESKEEALKFSELAECYAQRLQDLARMMDRIRILPDCREAQVTEDSSTYLSPPAEVHQSVRLSRSVKAGEYPPKPEDESVLHGKVHRASPCQDLPPSHIYPHPSAAVQMQTPSSYKNHSRRLGGTGIIEQVAQELSTIQEAGESQRPVTPQCQTGFDPDVSSIRGSPQQKEARDSTGSSLCLLDDRDISSWLGSSSDDYEDVFRSLGIAWALPTFRKTRQSQQRVSESQSSSRSSARGQYSHSTPLAQSPAKPHTDGRRSRQQRPASLNSDSLTPPSLSLNIPDSVLPKSRRSK